MKSRDHAALRGLELAVLRKLDGMLQGDYHGLLPGHGWDMGEARQYVPGDDVRRIDWNVTARTSTPHVRDTIVDRELETVLVADLSASMSFGTADREKRDVVLSAAGAIGFLASGGGNRVGAMIVEGANQVWVPPRAGRSHLYQILRRIQAAPDDGGPGALGSALRATGRLAVRRGLAVVISDFLGERVWEAPLRGLTQRHDVLAIEVIDPRELALPDVGNLTVVDPETGRRRRVDTRSRRVRSRYAAAAASQRRAIARSIRAGGADHMVLRTDRDWLLDIVNHVSQRRERRHAAALRVRT